MKENQKKDHQEKDSILKKIIKERAPKESTPPKDDAIEKLVQEKEELKKKFLYLAAEKENTQKTLQKEIQNAKDFAISSFARDVLGSVKNFEKALSHIDSEKDSAVKSNFDGLRLILNEMIATLKRHGVSKIEAAGQMFDHNFHQAIKTLKDENLPNNTIKEVLDDGYIINGRLLCPAIVVVVSNDE
jgi:molecular chaperone GrpE